MLEALVWGSLGAVVISGAYVWSTNNRLMALDERCNTAFSDVDALLKHRSTLIPPLVESIKGFVGQERHAIDAVTNARYAAIHAVTAEMRTEAEVQIGFSLQELFATTDKFPQLTSSPHFVALRNELIDVENRITAARRFYNTTVEEFNSTLRQFPGSALGRMHRVSRRQPYSLGAERVLVDEAVAISFS